MTWTILHNCLQMIYFRVLGTLVFHLFFKKKKSLSLWYRLFSKKIQKLFLYPFILISLQVRQMCVKLSVTRLSTAISLVQQLDKLPEDMMTVYYARITLISDLENEAENANRSRVQVIICQHNGSNTNETV